jgi:probable DNA metabolism protein
MQVVIYDGSFDHWLCAVFDIYEYKFAEADICRECDFNGNIFQPPHYAIFNKEHSDRVWKGLQKKLSPFTLRQLYMAFLTGLPSIENNLLRYVQYVFQSAVNVECDFSHPDVIAISMAAKKAGREKHRMEAFVRFQKTKDELYYAIIEPDFNVLPLITPHFQKRYADQPWLIYDSKRRYGIYYDLNETNNVEISFSENTCDGNLVAEIADEQEDLYQQLWHQYFTSVNITARKNTRLHIQHMPRRYWKHLPEKIIGLQR